MFALSEVPASWIFAAVVIVGAACGLILLWWIWKPRQPVQDAVDKWRENFAASLPPSPTNAEVQDDSLWPFPTWRVHERPFDWRID